VEGEQQETLLVAMSGTELDGDEEVDVEVGVDRDGDRVIEGDERVSVKVTASDNGAATADQTSNKT